MVCLIPNIFTFDRACFRKMKRPRIGCFAKRRPIWKKLFLDLNQKSQKQLPVRGPIKPDLIWLNSQFYLNNFFIFICFIWSIFTHILIKYMLCTKFFIMNQQKCTQCKEKKFVMKYFLITNQNFYKSNFHCFTFSMDCTSSIFYKYIFIYVNKAKERYLR